MKTRCPYCNKSDKVTGAERVINKKFIAEIALSSCLRCEALFGRYT